MLKTQSQLLPAFIEPMLAGEAAPFDGDDWLFEIKWDGFRAIARRDAEGCRLIGRRTTDFTSRFSALAKVVEALPPGTIVDGEIVAMVGGKPNFTSLLRRTPGTKATIAYVAFDLLFDRYQPVMSLTCEQRRERLRQILAGHVKAGTKSTVQMSEGVIGDGQSYFREASAMGLEGVMAKRLDSVYRPGVRTGDWLKIRRRQTLVCVVIGYEPSPEYGLRSLIIASPADGELVCAGRVGSGMRHTDDLGLEEYLAAIAVGSGIDSAMRTRLLKELRKRERPTPVVACRIKGNWVEPQLFCRVSYAQQLESGSLREPVFEGLIEPL